MPSVSIKQSRETGNLALGQKNLQVAKAGRVLYVRIQCLHVLNPELKYGAVSWHLDDHNVLLTLSSSWNPSSHTHTVSQRDLLEIQTIA